MAYFRQLATQVETMQEVFSRDERWLILINADPDALASAMALKRMMVHRVASVDISHVNEVTRMDNLSMIHFLRIPSKPYHPNMAHVYDRFALVDSQPHHHPVFEKISFSLVFDHHPLVEDEPVIADYKDIQPTYGSNSSMMVEYLYSMNIKPGKLLATALLYGIKSDTQSFERDFHDVDARAFRWLSKFSSQALLKKIVSSEFKLDWLEYFSRAFGNMKIQGTGLHVYLGEVENPDILVILADFFLRVHEIRWSTMAGVYDNKLVIIFRSDGIRNVGKMAHSIFGGLGSAGGHKSMGRAEIPLEALGGKDPEKIVNRILTRKKSSAPAAEPVPEAEDCIKPKTSEGTAETQPDSDSSPES